MSEGDSSRKSLEQHLASVSPKIREEYTGLLLKHQLQGSKNNHERTITVTVEDRERLLKDAETNVLYGHVDSEKMATDWDTATSKDGRPPIGGAQDD